MVSSALAFIVNADSADKSIINVSIKLMCFISFIFILKSS